MARLFNPRTDKWSEHFRWLGAELVGVTPIARATIIVLAINDSKHRVIRIKIVSVGSLDTTVVHPREVFREAASASAAAIVLFHNHPSGDPTPSADDLALTPRMISEALEQAGV